MSSNTPNLNLLLQDTGSNSNAWGSNLNAQVFTNIDQALGSAKAVTMTSADVTLSQTDSQNLVFNITGILTASVNLIFPASVGRLIIVNNGTTGAFTITVKSLGGTGVSAPQGVRSVINIDPSNNTAYIPSGYLSSALPAGDVFVGNGAGIATAQALSGAITLNTAGLASLAANIVLGTNLGTAVVNAVNIGTSGVTAGTYTAATVVVNAQGQVTSANNGIKSPIINSQIFTSIGTATFTSPSATLSTTSFKVTLTGAGGGSGGVSNGASPGGAAGSTAIYYATGLTASTGYTITVGAAGAAGSSAPGNGGSGGNSTAIFGATTVTAPGGNGSPATSGGAGQNGVSGGGACTNATISIPGGSSYPGSFQGNASLGGVGGTSLWGGGGASSITNSNGAGGGGGAGQAGQAYGSGAGGSNATGNVAGAAGANGICLIEWVL